MGGTREETDVLGLWLASRQTVRGERVAAHAAPVPAPVEQPVERPPAEPAVEPVAHTPEQVVRRVHPLAPRPGDGPSRPDVEFAPRNGAHRLAGALLVAATAGWALAGWWAWEQASTTWAGVAAIVGLLAVGLWFLRAASAPPRVRITGGTLHIEEHGQHHTWDLTNPFLRLEVRGRVGRPGWKVLLLRPQQPAYVVDAAVVEPREFLAFLRSYRPEL